MTPDNRMQSESPARPIGRVQPKHDRALRAVKALQEDRLDDAQNNVDAIPTDHPAPSAWKLYLQGRITFTLGEIASARNYFAQAAALALQRDPGGEFPEVDLCRLAGESLTHLGRAYRRAEQLDQAIRAHEASFQLRREHGSLEEQWESAADLGLDYDLARRFADAATWYERAQVLARRSSEAPLRKQAETTERLCATLLALQRFDEAEQAGRLAHALWREHDPGCIEVFRSEFQIGHALLAHAQALFDADPTGVWRLLEGAVESLTLARRELIAFGAEGAEDARSCEEQLDFAQRLLQSLS
jgi:tetratricopeptide (TPR) repeat protein